MRITERRLRQIIREAFGFSGYIDPSYKKDFIDKKIDFDQIQKSNDRKEKFKKFKASRKRSAENKKRRDRFANFKAGRKKYAEAKKDIENFLRVIGQSDNFKDKFNIEVIKRKDKVLTNAFVGPMIGRYDYIIRFENEDSIMVYLGVSYKNNEDRYDDDGKSDWTLFSILTKKGFDDRDRDI
tara:strand:+ start:78 stop:623 length:546 start_codon:yes stop_codon:yes gene_type:complete